MHFDYLAYPCLLGAIVLPSQAHAAPGDVFVTESLSGSVLEFSDGGDFSDAPRFATGLEQPTGVCRGPDGHIYVVETVPGEITIIDDGGDFTDTEPFAYGVPNLFGLWCDDERILTGVFIGGIGAIADVSAGGFIPDIPVEELRVAMSPSVTSAVVVDGNDNMYAVGGDVWDVTGGGDHTMDPAYAFGVAVFSGSDVGGVAFAGQFQGPNIYDFSAGGDLTLVTPWATLPDHGLDGVEGIVDAGSLGVFAMIGNEIYDVTAGGDLSLSTPFATGLDAGLNGEETIAGVEGMLHHVCSTNTDCADDDLCNGDELCVNNACLPPEGPPDCNDDDICTADACAAASGCSNEAIANCCHDDFDCAIDEVCDAETDQCVPTDPTGGEASSGAGSEDSSSGDPLGTTGGTTPATTTAPTSGAPSSSTDATSEDTDDEPGAASSGDGCQCTTATTTRVPAWLTLLLFTVPLRRRKRSPFP